MKKVVFIFPLVLFLVLGAYFAAGLQRNPSRIPSVLIDRPLPEFSLPAIEGFDRGLSSADLHGEVALINVFGSWCVSCIIEHPMLMEIAETEDVIIAGLNWKDPPGAGARWLAKHGNPYSLIGDDRAGRIAIDFGVTGAPETFLVDRSGRIRFKQVGPITPQIWREDIKPVVDQLKDEGRRAEG